MSLDVDDRCSEGPETVTVPDWPSRRVDAEACKLLVKVNNYSRQPPNDGCGAGDLQR